MLEADSKSRVDGFAPGAPLLTELPHPQILFTRFHFQLGIHEFDTLPLTQLVVRFQRTIIRYVYIFFYTNS